MKNHSKRGTLARVLSVVAVAAMVGGLSAVASAPAAYAASGDVITPVAQKYKSELLLEPQSGTWDTALSGVSTDGQKFTESPRYGNAAVSIVKGQLSQSGSIIVLDTPGYTNTGPIAGPYDFGQNEQLTFKTLGAAAPATLNKTKVGETFAVVLSGGVNDPLSGNYFRADLEVTDLGNGLTGWKVAGTPSNTRPIPVVELTNKTQPNEKSALVTARVIRPDGSVATDATGTIALTMFGRVVTQMTLRDGVATFITADWFDKGTHVSNRAISAVYVPAANAPYFHSLRAQSIVDMNIGADPNQIGSRDISVTIPELLPTGLQLTVAAGTVVLGDAASTETAYTASAALPRLTVVDGRVSKTAWAVSGRSTVLTNTSDATKTIAASHLGWDTPVVSDGVVSGGATTDLSSTRALASWANSTVAGVVTSHIRANVQLNAPKSTAAGQYASTLTFTLI
ncbi:hypothetical protein B0I08_10594 [Glaciihabitans tibetensis]|uniref:Surface cell wall-binding protein n=1 Tax=Glaciihabitans tibetensis TaxID=1266600 RepID=A0A2T0VCN0_9MICO|nr:hypothetical protein [Glaciihabitans tibetensis]PRY67933.1 hypothetical protein B0I08_10594 [Glaciihabitans tibetensis]